MVPDYRKFSDNDLVRLLRESDHTAFTAIYHRYFHLLYIHAYKKLRNEEQAKDVIQEFFAALWFKRETISVNVNLAGYLYTALRNRIFDLFAHEKVASNYLDSLHHYMATVKNAPTDYLIREKQLSAYIEKEIQALPPKMRRIFEMSRKEHLPHAEIAERTGTSENNVSTQITSALRILRAKLGVIALICYLLSSK